MLLQHENGSQVEAKIGQKVEVFHLQDRLYIAGFEQDCFGDECLLLKGCTGNILSAVFGPGEVLVRWQPE